MPPLMRRLEPQQPVMRSLAASPTSTSAGWKPPSGSRSGWWLCWSPAPRNGRRCPCGHDGAGRARPGPRGSGGAAGRAQGKLGRTSTSSARVTVGTAWIATAAWGWARSGESGAGSPARGPGSRTRLRGRWRGRDPGRTAPCRMSSRRQTALRAARDAGPARASGPGLSWAPTAPRRRSRHHSRHRRRSPPQRGNRRRRDSSQRLLLRLDTRPAPTLWTPRRRRGRRGRRQSQPSWNHLLRRRRMRLRQRGRGGQGTRSYWS